MLTFTVENSITYLTDAPEYLLASLDKCLSYPTQIGVAKDEGATYLGEDLTWDGWVHFLKIPKRNPPHFPTGLWPQVKNLLATWQVPHQVTDRRVRPDEGIPEFSQIPLRDYQERAVELAIEAGQGVLDMPPRAGKTRVAVELVRRLALPTLWVAPTDAIVQQTLRVFDEFLGKGYAVHQIGTADLRENSLRQVVLCTAATAGYLTQEFYNTRLVVIVDEFHHSGGISYRKGIFDKCPHVFYRFGMTGTFYRSGTDALAMHAVLSSTIFKITSQELVQRGYLVPIEVLFCPVTASKLRGCAQGYITGHGRDGIHEHDGRNGLVARIAAYLSKLGRRVLVLVTTKHQGEDIAQQLRFFMGVRNGTEFNPVEFVHADRPRPIIQKVLLSFQQGQEVKILLGTSILGEGVDLPEADALVFARGEHAAVTLRQYSYRIGTAVPGKRNAVLVDFADRHHRKLMEHSMDRLRLYFEEPTFHVRVAESEGELANWLRDLGTNF